MALAVGSNTAPADDVMDLDIDMDLGDDGGVIDDDYQLEVWEQRFGHLTTSSHSTGRRRALIRTVRRSGTSYLEYHSRHLHRGPGYRTAMGEDSYQRSR